MTPLAIVLAAMSIAYSPTLTSAQGAIRLRLEHASHPIPPAAATVIVYVPQRFDPARDFRWIIFLHGYGGCATALVGSGGMACAPDPPLRRGFGLGPQADRVSHNVLLVVPQLTWLERDGDPGRFDEDGFARAFLNEAVERLRSTLGAGAPTDWNMPVTLVAHSAGFQTTLAIAVHGDLGSRLDSIVLLDALYGRAHQFAAWAASDPQRRLLSIYTGRGTTRRQSLLLARMSEIAPTRSASLALLRPAFEQQRVVVAPSLLGHEQLARELFSDMLRLVAE